MMVLYDMKNWASSIMGPSRVVFYKVKNWASSFTGPSTMMCVKWMSGATPFKLLSANLKYVQVKIYTTDQIPAQPARAPSALTTGSDDGWSRCRCCLS